MTVVNLYNELLVYFPDLTETYFLHALNSAIRTVAEDTEALKEVDSITTDGASAYTLSDELDHEPIKLKRVQLDGITIEGVLGHLLEDIDI